MSDTMQEIRDRILKNKKPVLQVQSQPPKKNTSMVVLGVIILLMSVATVAGMFYKKQRPPQIINHTERIERPRPVEENFMRKGDLDSKIDALSKRVDEQNSRLTLWIHRVWLLAVAQNENVNLSIQRGGDPGYIYFDDQWKMNRMPRTMEMDDNQRNLLKNDLK